MRSPCPGSAGAVRAAAAAAPAPSRRSPEARVRRPAELARGERRVEDAARELSEPRGNVLCGSLDAARGDERLMQLEHGRLDAGADVEPPTAVPEGAERGGRDIAGVD